MTDNENTPTGAESEPVSRTPNQPLPDPAEPNAETDAIEEEGDPIGANFA